MERADEVEAEVIPAGWAAARWLAMFALAFAVTAGFLILAHV